MAICQYITQDPMRIKFEPFSGVLGLGITLTNVRNGVKIFFSPVFFIFFQTTRYQMKGLYFTFLLVHLNVI